MLGKGTFTLRHLRRDGTLQLAALALLALLAAIAIFVRSSAGGASLDSLDPRTRLRAATTQRQTNTTDNAIYSLQERVRRNPADTTGLALLGGAYVQRARETGDPTYYGKAEAVLTTALKQEPQQIEVLIGQGTLALARHDFAGALQIGEQARTINPDVPRIYGVIADAQIELGRYDEAVQTVQQMVDLRPDLSSYSRVSYLRELYGDRSGAIEAMQAAVNAGGPAAENTQWVRVQLGNLFFNQGDLKTAEAHYQRALEQLPEYVPATAGLARVRVAQGQYVAAIELYTQAAQRMPLPEYVIALGDVYAKLGKQEQAQQQYQLVQAMDALLAANGVNTDLETALFFVDHDLDLQASLAKARAAYAVRPSTYAADVLAWALYKTGQYPEAQRYATEALRLGTQDSIRLFHAGMIAQALGQNQQARDFLRRALDLNPYFSLRYAELAATTLKQLDAAAGGNR